jgi:hypothetical protein
MKIATAKIWQTNKERRRCGGGDGGGAGAAIAAGAERGRGVTTSRVQSGGGGGDGGRVDLNPLAFYQRNGCARKRYEHLLLPLNTHL